MLQYIIQTILFQLIFLAAYDLFHKKDTFFIVNRAYLLVTSLLSLILPFMKVKSIQETIPDNYIVDLPTVFIGKEIVNTDVIEVASSASPMLMDINWWFVLYVTGILIAISIFIRKIIIICSLTRKSTNEVINTHPVRILPNSKDAFTFWNTIYIGNQLSDTEKKQILVHELVHHKQKHTLDLIWFEMIKIIFWFNPMVYIYHFRVIALHEYISDASAIKVIGKRAYYERLLNANFQTKNVKFANNFFNHKLLKKRIIMLQKTKSRTTAKLKYLSVVPLLLIMVTVTAFSQKAMTLADISSEKITDEIKEITNSFSSEDVNNEDHKQDKLVETNTSSNKDIATEMPPLETNQESNEVSKSKETKLSSKDSLSKIDRKIVAKLLEIKNDILENGKSFASRAVLYSEDPGSKGNGGHYFVTKETRFHEKFKDVSFRLKEGEISDPFRTPFGWHILTVDKIKTDGVDVRHILIIREQNIPFAVIEKVPKTKNCEHLTDRDKIKKCVSEEIKEFVNKNYNINIAKTLGLTGINRVFVRFKIDTSGNITEVESRGPAIALEEEANRVVSSLPQMIPGEHKGEKVNVLYSLPIVFNIEDSSTKKSSKTLQKNIITHQDSTKKESAITESLSDIGGHDIKNGYYLVTNIFKHKNYLEKGIKRLKKQGLAPKYFLNPKDAYSYVYLERYDSIEEAKKMLFSDFDGRYEGDMYILKIQ